MPNKQEQRFFYKYDSLPFFPFSSSAVERVRVEREVGKCKGQKEEHREKEPKTKGSLS